MAQKTSVFDSVVVGRGAVGLAAALALLQLGHRVALVGPAPAARSSALSSEHWDSRVYALSPASRQLLAALDVWPRLALARIAPVYEMRLFQERSAGVPDGQGIRLDAYEAQVEALAWIVENGVLVDALQSALADPGGARRLTVFDATVTAMQLASPAGGPARLQLSTEAGIQAGLVVGADGVDSTVRELAGLESRIRPLGQTAIVANFETTAPHRDCAWQWFGAEGVIALLPLPADGLPEGRGRASLVWSAPDALAAEVMAGAGSTLVARVETLSRQALGGLTVITPPVALPLRAVQMRRTVAPGCVVIGDAAHAVHPMAGQGMNLGFGDVAALLRVLPPLDRPVAVPQRVDWPTLRRYERGRREQVLAMQWALDGLAFAYGEKSRPFIGLRNIGWSLVARSPWIRRRMVSHAVS